MDNHYNENDDITEQIFYDGFEETVQDTELEFERLTPLREQDRFLPIANVSKIMKKAIPSTGKIAKEAKETMQECVSEYISFITSEAAERCQQEKRKTINGEDIIFAMTSLGFDGSIEPLRNFLAKYRECTKIEASSLNSAVNNLIDDQSMQTTQVFLTMPANGSSTYTEVVTTNSEDQQPQLSTFYATIDPSNDEQQPVQMVNGDQSHEVVAP